MRRMNAVIAAAACVGMTAALPAAAEESKLISGSLSIEVQDDHFYDATDGSEGNDLYTTIEAAASLHITPELAIEGGFTLEPVQDRGPTDDRAFDDHGAYVDTLILAWSPGPFRLYGGKFAAPFGLHESPGVYGDTFSEAYELTEQVGFGAGWSGEFEGFGNLGIEASVFTADTSFLASSVVTDRGRTRSADGGPGNTGDLGSFSVVIDAEPAALPGFHARAGYVRLGKGLGDAGDTKAWNLGAAYEIAVTEEIAVTPMIDYVRSDDGIGITGATYIQGAAEKYLTAGLAATYGSWNAALAYGDRDTDDTSAPGAADDGKFVQVSAGYAFDIGIGVDLAWARIKDSGVTTKQLGAVVSYGIEF